jgi:hypothetical protein
MSNQHPHRQCEDERKMCDIEQTMFSYARSSSVCSSSSATTPLPSSLCSPSIALESIGCCSSVVVVVVDDDALVGSAGGVGACSGTDTDTWTGMDGQWVFVDDL